jgi:hypothetical protein
VPVMTRPKVKTPAKPERRIVGRIVGNHHIDRRAGRLIEPGADDELLTTVAVADWLGVSCQWLELGRSTNYGPPYKRISEKIIRYRRGDVNAWLESRTQTCVAEYANG